MRYASEQGNFTAALAGDCMLTRRLSVYDEPEYLGLVDIFRKADAGFVNLEGVVRTPDEGTPGITQGTYMTVAPKLLEDLKWFGVNLVCCANNHAFDYGEGGLLATMRHLDAAGIAHAGSGQNLAEARMPGYLETKNGQRVFLADYKAPIKDGLGAKFIFPRTLEEKPFITEDSGYLRFYSELGKDIKLNMRFKVAELNYEGKLAY